MGVDQELRSSMTLRDQEIRNHILVTDNGIHVLLEGGDLGHIGAVSICYQGEVQTITIPGHKEAVISENWAKELEHAFKVPVVVEAGIHYDQISEEEIRMVLQLMNTELIKTKRMLETYINNTD